MSDFSKGILTGVVVMLVIALVILGFWFFNNRDRQFYEAMERQYEIQQIENEYRSRDPYEFLDTPGVRESADNATEEFQRKRDEAVQRIRGGYAD
jgi:flagellar basal body-associated protein FliL